MFGIQQQLNVAVCKDSIEAEEKGFIYRETHKPVEIKQVVVVQKGTVSGNSTVDLVMEDAEGNKFVVMLTGNLLKSIPC